MKTKMYTSTKHNPRCFTIDATKKTLGRLVCEIKKYLSGKISIYQTYGSDLGNFIVIFNADKILVTGKKMYNKIYYRNTQRPGGLKKENFFNLQNRLPSKIIEKAIKGMLAKNKLGRYQYKRLYVFSSFIEKDVIKQLKVL
jgi:large subunit ribosomal protein L13